ncbi:unnamed protein product, partial [Meganyctiphanes norvegica]
VALTEAQEGCTLGEVAFPPSIGIGKSYFCALQCGALDHCTGYCQTSSGCKLLQALFSQKQVVSGNIGTKCYMEDWGEDLADGKTVVISSDYSLHDASYRHKEALTNHGDCPTASTPAPFFTVWTSNQWISVDLGQEFLVTSVVIGCHSNIGYYENHQLL